MANKIDWASIKRDYLEDPTMTIREVAEKYNVSYPTVGKVSSREGWVEQRERYQIKLMNKTLTKSADRAADVQLNRAAKIAEVADKLLIKIGIAVDSSKPERLIRDNTLRMLTGSLKDLQTIHNLKSDLDVEEQLARIERLRRGSRDDVENDDMGVVLISEVQKSDK